MTIRLAIIGNQATALINFRGHLIGELVRRGHDVLALAPDFDAETRSAVMALGATPLDHSFSRAGLNPVRDLAAFADLVRQLRQARPDMVLAYTVKPVTYGLMAAQLAGVRRRFAMIEGLGHVFLGDASLGKRLVRAGVSLLYRSTLRGCRAVLFLNRDDRDDFLRRRLVPSGLAHVVGGIGVDLEFWRMPLPPQQKPVRFLFVGRLLREKGIEEFIAAARQLRASGVPAEFVVVGDIDSNPSSLSRAEVEAWVKSGLITWTGYAPVRPWLDRSSVFVLPSYREGVPRSTQEAMAAGRPVVTTDVPGCRETVIDGENGFLVPPENAAALADAMQRFIDAPELIEPMGRASRRLAEERFDERQATLRVIAALDL